MAAEAAARLERADRRQLLLYGAALLAAGLCLLWTFHDVDFGKVWRVLARLGMSAFGVLIPYGVSVLFDGLGLRFILAALGRDGALSRLMGIRLAAEALTLSLPAGPVLAEGVRLMLLQSGCQIPVTEGVSTLAARKCLIIQGHGLFLGLAGVLGWSFLSQRSAALLGTSGLPLLLCGTAAILLLVAAGMGRTLGGGSTTARVGLLLERLPLRPLRAWLERRRSAFAQTDTHLGRALEPRAKLRAALLYLLMWLAESFESYLLLRLLGFDVGLSKALALEAVISVARSLAFFVPAGLGVQDASYVALLRAGEGGATLELAAAFALLKRARELFWVGMGFALLLHARGRQQRATAP